MSVPEVIARLDDLERELEDFRAKIRLLKYDLFATLDTDRESLLD